MLLVKHTQSKSKNTTKTYKNIILLETVSVHKVLPHKVL